MSWGYEGCVYGWDPEDPEGYATSRPSEIAIIRGDEGRIELAIGNPGSQLCYGWSGAPGRIRLDRSAARRLAFRILSETE